MKIENGWEHGSVCGVKLRGEQWVLPSYLRHEDNVSSCNRYSKDRRTDINFALGLMLPINPNILHVDNLTSEGAVPVHEFVRRNVDETPTWDSVVRSVPGWFTGIAGVHRNSRESNSEAFTASLVFNCPYMGDLSRVAVIYPSYCNDTNRAQICKEGDVYSGDVTWIYYNVESGEVVGQKTLNELITDGIVTVAEPDKCRDRTSRLVRLNVDSKYQLLVKLENNGRGRRSRHQQGDRIQALRVEFSDGLESKHLKALFPKSLILSRHELVAMETLDTTDVNLVFISTETPSVVDSDAVVKAWSTFRILDSWNGINALAGMKTVIDNLITKDYVIKHDVTHSYVEDF